MGPRPPWAVPGTGQAFPHATISLLLVSLSCELARTSITTSSTATSPIHTTANNSTPHTAGYNSTNFYYDPWMYESRMFAGSGRIRMRSRLILGPDCDTEPCQTFYKCSDSNICNIWQLATLLIKPSPSFSPVSHPHLSTYYRYSLASDRAVQICH